MPSEASWRHLCMYSSDLTLNTSAACQASWFSGLHGREVPHLGPNAALPYRA